MNEIQEITRRIVELREACGYTAEEFAKELGIDPEVYRGYETAGSTIPVSVVYDIAHKCGVDFTEIITGVSAKLDTYHIVKRGEGRGKNRYPGYKFEDLAYRFSSKVMQPLLVTMAPGDTPAALVTHGGQEFNLVLEGSVEFVFDSKVFILNEGDSVYFNPQHPHGQRCYGDKKARFITVIAE